MAGRTYMGIAREKLPWRPWIDPEKCIGCGECMENCPNGVLAMNENEMKMEVVAPDNCVVLCDKCTRFCSQDAITFPDKEEIKNLIEKLLGGKEGATRQINAIHP